METPKIEALKQNAINALNHLIVSDELAKNYKAIMKISRFKEWLREAVTGEAPVITADNVSEVLDELNEGEATAESVNKEVPQTIKFD